MQNKGLIRVLAVLFALACLWQLSYTVATNIVDNKAKKAAENYVMSDAVQKMVDARVAMGGDGAVLLDSIKNAEEARYLDSMSSEKVWAGSTYSECQARELGLGLDLKGGMNVMLEVSTVDVVRELANNTDDELFNKAIEQAQLNQKNASNRDFVSAFYDAITSLDPNVNLASYFAGSEQMRGVVKLDDNNSKVIAEVKAKADAAYEQTFQILTQRVDKFGVAQPTIQKLSGSERILVELPGVKDPERVRKLLQSTAKLEFWLTYANTEAYQYLVDANKYIASISSTKAEQAEEADSASSLLEQLSSESATATDNAENPIFALMEPIQVYQGGPVVGYAKSANLKEITRMLEVAAEKRAYDSRMVKFLWSAKAERVADMDVYPLYAIKVVDYRNGRPLLEGDCVTDARQDFSANGDNEVSMTMNSEGARKWREITGSNVGNCIAIVLDDQVYSAPRVNGEIPGGRSQITGNFSLTEAKDLANILKSGSTPARPVIVSEAVVGPSLGKKSVRNGLFSFVLAFLVVLCYMVFFYKRAGWVSVWALIINVFLLIGILASIGTVLTLPGIAGIVLTMAMAVDGNVIIYERVKEELRAGASLSNAVNTGFKNALSAIVDGQVTTFLLGVVLIMFGSGAVQGFAVTLCVGIVTSLATSIFITRLFIDSRVEKKRDMSFSRPLTENFLRNANVDFIGKRKTYYIIAAAAIIICAASLVFRGLSMGIDFTGGRTYVVRVDQSVSVGEVRHALDAQFPTTTPEVKSYGPSNQVKITIKDAKNEAETRNEDEIKNDIVASIYAGMNGFYKESITLDEFKSTETNPYGIIQADQFGKSIANDNVRNSILAVIGGLIVMFVYIGLRFRSWRFGVGSVVALVHDTILVIGIFSLLQGLLPFSLEVDQYFITAVLTVIGYSINATVVIFDRVRENRKLYPKRSFKVQVNDAINATLARTVNTSGTTIVTLLAMFILGGEVIRGFIFALGVGVCVGVFSSLCIAGAVVYEISGKEKDEAEPQALKA